MKRTILLVSSKTHAERFLPYFEDAGITINLEETLGRAFKRAQEIRPDAIIFLLPEYWSDITVFVEKIKRVPGFRTVPILYLGSLIESEDQTILHRHGVKTLTLGPVPDAEVVRFIIKEL